MSSIPQELLVRVLLFCDYVSILRFSETCQTYHELVTESSPIQLQIELEASGFQFSDEALQNSGVTAQLLEDFKRYRDGWLYLEIGTPLRLLPSKMGMSLYELRQGYYAAAFSTKTSFSDTIRFNQLQTGSARTLALGMNFSEFQIDPSQDLIILVTTEGPGSAISTIQLNSIQTGNPHSGTRQPEWHVQFPFSVSSRFIFIEVMDDILAVKYVSAHSDTAEILVWDWKRAILLNRIQSHGTSCTFGFLDSDTLILFESADPEIAGIDLSIYPNIRSLQSSASDECGYYDVEDREPLEPRVCFGFPDLLEGTRAFLLLRGEPTPTMTASGFTSFLPRPDTRVLHLGITLIQTQGPRQGVHQHQLFISKDRLLKHILGLDNCESPGCTRRVPWDQWGEYTTRWFETVVGLSNWICRVYGTRFIQSTPLLHPDDSEMPHELISILDFHTPTVRRFSSLGRDERFSTWKSKDARRHIDLNSTDEDCEYVQNLWRNKLEAGIEGDTSVFVDTIDEDVPSETPFGGETVVTRLPYRIVTRVQPFPKHSGWMIDNNVIIGMPVDELQREDMNIYTPYVRN